MKLSVFTVSTPDLTPVELVTAAQDAGLDGIEWRFKETPIEAMNENPSFWRNNLCSIDPTLSEKDILLFKELTESKGLEVAALTPYLNIDNLEATELAFQTARLLGAKMIRVAVAQYDGSKPYSELFEKTIRYLREVERMAKQYGVKGVVETHHRTITPSAGLARRVVEGLNPEYIGVLFDPGMVHEGYENFKMGLELLGPYLAHVHIKNSCWKENGFREDGTVRWEADWAPLEQGIVNYSEVLAYLKTLHYDGYLGVEDFSGQFGSRELLKAFAHFMKDRL